MPDTAERNESIDENFGADPAAGTAASARAPLPEPAAVPTSVRASRARAADSARRETLRLVCAASFAVALGVGCGLWLNARLASAAAAAASAHANAAAPARLLPDVRAAASSAPAPPAESVPTEGAVPTQGAALPAGEGDGAPRASDEAAPPLDTKRPAAAPARTDTSRTRGEGRALKRVGGAHAATGAGESVMPEKTPSRDAGARGVAAESAAVRARRAPSPCVLYASAGALTLRTGGAAALILGGPGEHGRISVSTPDWADIAVFSEGPAGGGRGWMRYTVRSVSGRAGVYAVHFKTPCGSQTVPVTVRMR